MTPRTRTTRSTRRRAGLWLAAASFVVGGLFVLQSCSSVDLQAPRLFDDRDYSAYVRSLEAADLDDAVLGRTWLAAGRVSLEAPAAVSPPYREIVHFAPDRPTADAWRLEAERGRVVRVVVEPSRDVPADGLSDLPSRLFVELYRLEGRSGAEPMLEFLAEASRSEGFHLLEHEVEAPGTFVLRIQPELLAGGRFTVEITAGGLLTFPVEGQDARAIGSVFGDPRDGGARTHKGVDIFADRGTPAVAAADGRISRVGTNRLGGKVVWMRSGSYSMYYAHLDRQLVRVGESVAAGEPVGLVGNTGNARHTPPHLHFGLYGSGAIDPEPYLQPAGTPPAVAAPKQPLGTLVRIAGSRLRLRAEPTTRSDILDELTRAAVVRVRGAARDWYRVERPLPSATTGEPTIGYVAAGYVEPVEAALERRRPADDLPIYFDPSPASAEIARALAGEPLEILGRSSGAELVRTARGVVGWSLADGSSNRS